MASSSTVEHSSDTAAVEGSSPSLPTTTRYFKRRLLADNDPERTGPLIHQGFIELTNEGTSKVKEQNTGAEVYTEEDVLELKSVLARTRARSNNRRLALKQLHRAHQVTLSNLAAMERALDDTLRTAQELKQENDELRNELRTQYKEINVSRSWLWRLLWQR